MDTVKPWKRATPRRSYRFLSAMIQRLFSGSMRFFALKYYHILEVRFAREMVLSPPRNLVSAEEHL